MSFPHPSPPRSNRCCCARTIAVVGLSADASRPSHGVSAAMQRFGYRVIPVTPSAAQVLGERAVPDLDHLADVPRPANG